MTPSEQAKASIRATLGLSDDPTEWSYDERIAYNRALAAYVNANPGVFSAQEYANAQAQANRNNTPLSDTSFTSSLSDFGSAFVDEAAAAANDIGGIGRGVLNAASLSAWLIPLALVAVVVILLIGFKNKQGA